MWNTRFYRLFSERKNEMVPTGGGGVDLISIFIVPMFAQIFQIF